VVLWQLSGYCELDWQLDLRRLDDQYPASASNWDWVTKAQHWYGIGGTTDGAGGSPQTIPNSFYLTSKPAFFGTNTWPWVDPTTGVC
jgi:hypothetical protein